MRILIATPWTGFWSIGTGGGVPDEYLTFRALLERGHDVHVVAPTGADYALPDVGPGRLVVHEVPFPTRRWRGRWIGQLGRLRDVWMARRAFGGGLDRLVRQIEPQLILAHTFQTVPWAARVGRRLGVPVIGKFFGVLELNQAWQPSWLHYLKHFEHYLAFQSACTRFIVLNDGTGGDQAARRLGVAEERLRFWPNGVDTQWAEADRGGETEVAAARRRFGLPDSDCLLLTLCNLLPLKRVDRLLAAVALVPEVRAVVAGDGEQRAALEGMAAELGMAERVHFLGALDHDAVPDLMRAVDVYVAPHDLTNAGLPTCEAMLCGLPVVALEIGNTAEVVRHGETGLLVPEPLGPAGLATAIRRLAHDPEHRAALGARGREVAHELFVSWEERVSMEMELLEAAAQEQVADRPRLP